MDTSLIEIRQEITKLLLFKGFNMADLSRHFEYLWDFKFLNYESLQYFYNQSIWF